MRTQWLTFVLCNLLTLNAQSQSITNTLSPKPDTSRSKVTQAMFPFILADLTTGWNAQQTVKNQALTLGQVNQEVTALTRLTTSQRLNLVDMTGKRDDLLQQNGVLSQQRDDAKIRYAHANKERWYWRVLAVVGTAIGIRQLVH